MAHTQLAVSRPGTDVTAADQELWAAYKAALAFQHACELAGLELQARAARRGREEIVVLLLARGQARAPSVPGQEPAECACLCHYKHGLAEPRVREPRLSLAS
jgi:hypothetical protein